MPIRTFAELKAAVEGAPARRVVIPAAADPCALEAMCRARAEGLAEGILIDSRRRIAEVMEMLESEGRKRPGIGVDDFEIVETEDPEEAAARGVELIRNGAADLIAKGRLQTYQLMHAVLDREKGLRRGRLLSDVMLVEKPKSEEPRLIGITDPALCILPSLEEKKQIIQNAVEVFHRLGVREPKVAVICALEVVKESMPATVDARKLQEMNERGEIQGCIVEGPLSMDIAISRHAAEVKKMKGRVPGDADILVVPNIETGNVLAKTFAHLIDTRLAHIVVGARVPVVMSSRADSSDTKYNSLLVGLLLSGEEERR